jgi:SAM-dependent methyltransferase
MSRESQLAAQQGLAKVDAECPDGGAAALLAILESVIGPLRPGGTILDLGCGIGKCVRELLDRGFDAYGLDVCEYWGADRALYWEATAAPIPAELASRLRVAPTNPYRMPFADGAFDHIISTQVLEHVDDLDAVFAEIARTLRPGGASVHIFPSRWAPPFESHIFVPFPVLCHSPAYLKAMAILGLRSPRQRGLRWSEVYRTNLEQMKVTHYPRLSEVIGKAERAGLDARYVADVRNLRPSVSRLHRALTAIGIPELAERAVMMLQQPRLLLSRPSAD